jgi:hypothetical protein
MTLTTRQNLMVRSALAIVQKIGPWGRGVEADGAGYIGGKQNDGFDRGFACGNCVFMQPPNRCAIVKGRIEEDGLCRLHVIPNDRLTLGGAQAALGRVVGEVDVEQEEVEP